MKKEYTSPEIIITSYEAESDIMVTTTSSVQTNLSSYTKSYTDIIF